MGDLTLPFSWHSTLPVGLVALQPRKLTEANIREPLSQSMVLTGPEVPPGRFPNYMLGHREGWVRILGVNTL